MLLLAAWARSTGERPPVVLSVDHGLQRESAHQASHVADRARAHGLESHVLRWSGRKPGSDIEAAAREARYRLCGEWCCSNRIGGLYVAHTIDDQAETFLLRLARGSGVDGLSCMSTVSSLPIPRMENVTLVRPLLNIPRSMLRNYLLSRKEPWLEDAMNTDPRFGRARLRAVWPALTAAGLTSVRIADACRHLARARDTLQEATGSLLARIARIEPHKAWVDGAELGSAPEEIGLRALADLLMHISGRVYRPRFARLEALLAAVRSGGLGGGRTLHGCRIRPFQRKDAVFGAGTISIGREAARRGTMGQPRREPTPEGGHDGY